MILDPPTQLRRAVGAARRARFIAPLRARYLLLTCHVVVLPSVLASKRDVAYQEFLAVIGMPTACAALKIGNPVRSGLHPVGLGQAAAQMSSRKRFSSRMVAIQSSGFWMPLFLAMLMKHSRIAGATVLASPQT